MSDDEEDESLDEFKNVNEELSSESEIVDVSDVSLSSKSSSPCELDEEGLFDIDNVELTVNPVGDVVFDSDDESEVSDYAYFSTIGGDFAEDHGIKRKSGSYINNYMLINSGGMVLMRKKNELSGTR
eukprot:12045893-Ditylum_brightwellii.AAC.1